MPDMEISRGCRITGSKTGERQAPSPWLSFFREVRRLAAILDAQEQNKEAERDA